MIEITIMNCKKEPTGCNLHYATAKNLNEASSKETNVVNDLLVKQEIVVSIPIHGTQEYVDVKSEELNVKEVLSTDDADMPAKATTGKRKNKEVPSGANEEKRKRKRELERERRKKIKDDPKKREQQQLKEHQKYLRQKEREGSKREIAELTPRQQRLKRIRWKINSQNYRLRKRQAEEQQRALVRLEESTPPPSDEENPSLRKQARKIMGRAAYRNEIRFYREKVNSLERKIEAYRKCIQKLKYKNRAVTLLSKSLELLTPIQTLGT